MNRSILSVILALVLSVAADGMAQRRPDPAAAAGKPLTLSAGIGGKTYQATGRGTCRHTPDASIYGVSRFIDQQIPPPDGKSHSIVYTVAALVRGATGGAVSTSKQASVTVTIDLQKGAALSPPPVAAPPDSAPDEPNLDALPRPRGRP